MAYLEIHGTHLLLNTLNMHKLDSVFKIAVLQTADQVLKETLTEY